ncbi:MAG: class I SAM-dependent methyltransferase [Candidatus Moraniibacteriota bacterium]
MKTIINKLHKSAFLGKLVHTLDYCLKKELGDCETVLDLGCGPSSPVQFCKNIKYSVGVEAFPPYLKASKERKIHNEYLAKKIEELDFPENSFDAVIMIEVLEHLPQELGLEILKKAELWARKKVIVSSPNGFIAQKEVDGNPLQKHLSGWDYEKMKGLKYDSQGLAGLNCLRQEVQNDTMGDDFMTSIKFWPKPFWFIVATVSQVFVYYIPSLAFELFSVKNKQEKKG